MFITKTMASLAKNSSELAFSRNLTEESAASPGAISSGRVSGRSSISSSPSGRKRAHPTSLSIDDETPPNKRLPTPTQEEKESILREKQVLYRRLAEAESTPFYLTPHQGILPFLPFSGSIYSLLQQQQQQQTSPPRLPTSASPSRLATCSNTATSVSANLSATSSQPSTFDSTSNNLGITGLPTPGGSSVSTPSFPMQFYPATLMKYPFSPPTPCSLSLSPWNGSNGTNVESSSDTTESTTNNGTADESRGGAKPHDIPTGQSVVANQKNEHTVSNNSSTLDASSSSNNEKASTNSPGSERSRSNPKSGGGNSIPVAAAYSWQTPNGLQNSPHIMSPHSNFMSAQSPLNCLHPSPLSPMMLIHSPYTTNSVSSCLSVGSSSGFSSASEGASASGSQMQGASYAPSEYHVGPRRPLSERLADEIDNQSEGASNSGRNTPVDVSSEDNEENVTLAPGDLSRVSQNVITSGSRMSSAPYHPLNSSVQQAPNETSRQQAAHHHSTAVSSYPFSVESLSASQPSSVNSQGYLGNIHLSSSVERPSSGVSSMSSSLSSRGSTPEPPEELKPDPYQPPLGGDIFCMVPGRLSLLSSTQKYKVTVDEVRRRLSHPECLNASVLGGILRRAKSKNGGHILRQRLESIGVSLPPGRRKATELSLLTSLVEGESLHLASDFRRLCDNYFPHSELAQIIATQHSGTPEAEHRISMVKATQLIVSELQAMLNAVGGPSNIRPNDPNNPYPGLTNFSLLSHGFGNPTINTSLNVLQTYLQELLAFYEGRKPLPPQDSRYAYGTINHKVPSSGQPSHLRGGPAHCRNHMANNSLLHGNSDVSITSVRSGGGGGGMGVILKQEPVEPSSSCVVQHRSAS